MLWTELLINVFPIDRELLWQQMLARFCLLFLVWLTGLVAYTLDGLMASYIFRLQIYPILFVMGLIVLFGSYMIQRTLSNLIRNIRPILKLDSLRFKKFHETVKGYSYNFLPCLLLAIGLVIFASGAPNEFQQGLLEGFKLHVIWNLSFSFFIYLLTATGIWMFISIWLTIFLISQQPLDVKLSPEVIEKFRDLSITALWVSLGYFLGLSISIGLTTFSGADPVLSLFEIIVSPSLIFIAVGVIWILLPFYNIHKALIKLKRQELLKIKEESEQLVQQLDEILIKQPASQLSHQTLTIMAHLFSLHFKEKHVRTAKEWPIDISFLSKLAGLVLIPIIGRIAAMLIIS